MIWWPKPPSAPAALLRREVAQKQREWQWTEDFSNWEEGEATTAPPVKQSYPRVHSITFVDHRDALSPDQMYERACFARWIWGRDASIRSDGLKWLITWPEAE